MVEKIRRFVFEIFVKIYCELDPCFIATPFSLVGLNAFVA